jgi:predicted metal-dependent phosphoesterase TrpH
LNNPDLHSHSTVSDGTVPPAALVARAARRGVTTLALTDHDDTGGLADAALAAHELGVRLVNGVEISVTWRAQTIHVVGLGIDPQNTALQSGLAATRAGRADRAQRMAAAFDALGITGTLAGALVFAGNPRMVSRTHFARHLLASGQVRSMKDAFRRWLGEGRPCCVEQQWAALGDAVGWINASGGVAVIAHPGRYALKPAPLRGLLAEFRECGGGAIEVVTASHKPHENAVFAKHAAEFGLAASCGSDFHSPEESHDLGGLPPLPLGCEPVLRRLSAH